MSTADKLYPAFILLSVLIGMVAGQIEFIQANADLLILPLLMGMLYLTFLQIPLQDIQESMKNVKFTVTSLLINFVWTPLLAWLLALLLLGSHPAVFIGFIMLLVTPCTDWYLIFTGIAKGNVALSTAILPLNLLLQILLLPVYLLIADRSLEQIEPALLMRSVLFVLIVPFVLALLTKNIIRKKRVRIIRENIVSRLYILPVVFLCFAIMAMFAGQRDVLLNNLDVVGRIAIPVIIFFMVNLLLSQWIGSKLKFSSEDSISLSLTTLARNSPLALAIAMTAFPSEPLIALTLVIGPIIELPALALLSHVLIFMKKD